MGSKSASKEVMTDAGVSCVPGYHGEDQSFETISSECEKMGYPVMLKAVLGGGGKGMRICRSAEELPDRLDACRREAMASFADDRMLVERFVEAPRHVEFQVVADSCGDAVHLFERDCSVQRRHQKVLEEAPAPGLTPELRRKMGEQAVAAAKAVNYEGAGTVEFIFDPSDDNFYFMEMNTRLQVEHPVTEMITGQDLVEWQLMVAAGHALPMEQEALEINGHSIEARVYAERPRRDFLPGNGQLLYLQPPSEASFGGSPEDVRVESGVVEGDPVSVHYDPMISKLVVHAPDRNAALARMEACLRDYHIVGVPTNVEFLLSCVQHEAFRAGGVDTDFIEDHMDVLMPMPKPAPPKEILALAAVALALDGDRARSVAAEIDGEGAWSSPALRGFRPSAAAANVVDLADVDCVDGQEGQSSVRVRSAGRAGSFNVDVGSMGSGAEGLEGLSESILAEATLSSCGGRVEARIGQANLAASVVLRDESPTDRTLSLFLEPNALDGALAQYTFNVPRPDFGDAGGAGGGGSGVRAPMPGKVVKVLVEEGTSVTAGTPLMVLEAMKMEHVMEAPSDGVVAKVMAGTGDYCDDGATLVTFESEEA
jgi:3-methylcrotonyl-CoA carboxylase alpha subunit